MGRLLFAQHPEPRALSTSISPEVLLGRKAVAHQRREEGNEAETAASQSGGRAGPQRVWTEGKALDLADPPYCVWVLGFLLQPFPFSAGVHGADSAHGP